MGWIISTILAFVICGGVAVGAGFVYNYFLRDRGEDAAKVTRVVGWGAWACLVLWLLLSTALSSIYQVPAGHVGIVYQFTNIVGQKGEGLAIVPPWQSVEVADVRIQKIRPETTCFDGSIEQCLEAFSIETQDVFVIPTLNMSVSTEDVQELYRTVGPDYLSKLVRPRVHQVFKDETVKYKSVNVAPNREAIRIAVRDRLIEELGGFSITVHDLLIDNLDFRPEFKKAIEDKQIATQEAMKQQELIKASEAEAQQVIAGAVGEAERLRTEAQGQADANRLINASLTPMLIQFQAVQLLTDNVQIALIPSGQQIIIDPTTMLSGREAE